MIMKMKKLKKGERGFTLVELIIVVVIAGIVASAITGTTLYMLNVNVGIANRMAAVRQVRNVGFWISPDFQMARAVDPTDDPDTPALELLTLSWIEWESYDSHEVIYTLEDMSSSEFKILQRSHSVNGGAPTLIPIAEYIDSDQTSINPGTPCSFPDCGALKYKLTVTATVGEQSETREYEVQPRPGSQ